MAIGLPDRGGRRQSKCRFARGIRILKGENDPAAFLTEDGDTGPRTPGRQRGRGKAARWPNGPPSLSPAQSGWVDVQGMTAVYRTAIKDAAVTPGIAPRWGAGWMPGAPSPLDWAEGSRAVGPVEGLSRG
jgi:hypothetical protein